MRICIIDDDISMCHEIEEKVKAKYGKDSNEITLFSDYKKLLDFSKSNSIDVMLVDVDLKEENGIELSKQVKVTNPQVITVYISAYPQYVFKSFETEPLNYILKPIDNREFNQTLDRVLEKYTSYHQTMVIKNRSNAVSVEIIDICFIEGYNRHITYHLYDGTVYKTHGSLEKTYNQIHKFDFVRCHQGFIVNMKYIKSFDEDEIILVNGQTVPMSVRKKIETKQTYFSYLNRR